MPNDWFGLFSAYHDEDDQNHDDLTDDDFDDDGPPLPLIIGAGSRSRRSPAGHRRLIHRDRLRHRGAAGTTGDITPATVEQPRKIPVCLDRPFGFHIIQRSTALVLGAGWAAGPEFR